MDTPQEWEITNAECGGGVIDSRNIAGRLDDLNAEHVDGDGEEIPRSQWPAVAREEFEALTELLEDISGNVDNGWDLSANGDCLMLVRDTHLTDYVQHWYDDTYGGDLHTRDRYGIVSALSWDDVMQREPFCWINWDDVADAWKQRCAEIEYYGVTYYLDF